MGRGARVREWNEMGQAGASATVSMSWRFR